MLDERKIADGLRAIVGDSVFEVRIPSIPGKYRQTASGYFDNIDDAVAAIRDADNRYKPPGIYVTLNEINPACFDRSPNRLTLNPKNTTTDADITSRRWIPIDLDPIRPAGINATDDERRAAQRRLAELIEMMSALGWPKPVSGATGNGAMALYAIDTPNTDATRDMVKETLRMLSSFFDDARVKVDQAVWNAARIWKIPGTVARKGPESEARRHCVAELFNATTEPLPLDVWRRDLDWFKGAMPEKQYKGKAVRKPIDLEAWCREYGIGIRDVLPWRGAKKYVLDHCPFDDNHDGTSVVLFQFDSGAIMFKCLHDSCSSRTWRDVRDHVGDSRPAGASGAAHVPKDFGGLTNVEANGTPRDITAISDELFGYTDEWPRKCAGQLFVVNDGEVRWLSKQSELFAWLHESLGVVWLSRQGSVTKEEFYGHLLGRATAYDDVQAYPHWPPRPNSFYLRRWSANGDGKALAGLVDFFRPKEREDEAIIKAMFVSLFWGGPGGRRPMFVITSADGQGTGKTTMAKVAAELVGGSIDLRTSERPNSWTDRILSPGARSYRVALLDNVKDVRIDSQELEEIITCREISGRQMFVGEGRRENNLTYICTLNTSGMSSDLAQRSYQIEIVKPSYDPKWDQKIEAYVAQNHERIIADCGAILSRETPATTTTMRTRWGLWEQEVLLRSHGKDIDPIIKHNIEVQAQLDDDAHPFAEFMHELKGLIAQRLMDMAGDSYSPLDNDNDPDRLVLLLKMPLIAKAWTLAQRGAEGRQLSNAWVGRMVQQGIAKGYNKVEVGTADGVRAHEQITFKRTDRSRVYIWTGIYASEDYDPNKHSEYRVLDDK